MLPKIHIIVGFIFSALVYFIYHITLLEASLIFLASFLIDTDHYLAYVFIEKDLNPIKSVKYFYKKMYKELKLSPKERKKYKKYYFIFHGVECWILLSILSFFYKPLIFILIGVLFHLILDEIEIYKIKDDPLYKLSMIYIYFSNKRKKRFL